MDVLWLAHPSALTASRTTRVEKPKMEGQDAHAGLEQGRVSPSRSYINGAVGSAVVWTDGRLKISILKCEEMEGVQEKTCGDIMN